MRRFKRQFLLIYSTKSRSQRLRRCGNKCRKRWDWGNQEGRCLDRSIPLISNSNGLEDRRTPLFIHILGVTVRSTVTMKRSIVDRFENIAAVGSSMEDPDDPIDKRYKNAWICAPWIAIGRSRCAPRRLIRTVIIPLISDMLDQDVVDRGCTRSARFDRDPTSLCQSRHLQF